MPQELPKVACSLLREAVKLRCLTFLQAAVAKRWDQDGTSVSAVPLLYLRELLAGSFQSSATFS